MVRGLRSRSLRAELRVPTSRDPCPRSPTTTSASSPTDPAPPTMSRRGALALVGGGSLLVAALTAGQTLGGPLRGPGGPAAPRAQLRRRRRRAERLPGQPDVRGDAGSSPVPIGAAWRLDADRRRGARPARPRRRWPRCPSTPRRCRSRASRAGRRRRPGPGSGCATSPPSPGCPRRPRRWSARWRRARSRRRRSPSGQVLAPGRAARAARSTGRRSARDHGYPARVIVPALPGVHNTKWVRSIEFRSV